MKKVITSSFTQKKTMNNYGKKIVGAAQALLDVLEEADESFLEANDLRGLYDELIETLPGFDFAVKSGSINAGYTSESREDDF
jgi:isocitrate dehydrogenase kinase/phosphatase